MKSKIIILGIIVVSLAVYGYFKAVPGAQDGGKNLPKIEVRPQFFDFGEISYGQIVKHTFIVKNTGEGVLEIKKVATSCGCTTAEVDKEIINPNEEAKLLVTYDSGAMSGSHAREEQERIIYIKSNDPINPQAEVIISSYVR